MGVTVRRLIGMQKMQQKNQLKNARNLYGRVNKLGAKTDTVDACESIFL
jgi:hypothetical protein